MVQSALQATLVTLSPHPSMVYNTSPPLTLHTYPVSSSPPVATTPALVFNPQQNTDPVCLENTSLLWSTTLFSCSSIKASSWSIPPGSSTSSSSSSSLSSAMSSCISAFVSSISSPISSSYISSPPSGTGMPGDGGGVFSLPIILVTPRSLVEVNQASI